VESVTQVRRDQWAGTVFSTWVVLGLFLDGWAHNAGKPEDFWTPWHAVLYSGFAVAAGWFAYERWRRRRDGIEDQVDPLLLAGFVAFAVAGVGDGVWHSVFGVEEDIAALLSPTHLALMVGGVLLVTGPVRGARDLDAAHRSWSTFAPAAIAMVLTVAVIGFFLQFLSAFHVHDLATYTAASAGGTVDAMHGVAAILVTNLLLIAGLAWTISRWPAVPVGTCTAVLTGPALLFSSLHAFEHGALVLAPLLGGITADVLLARRAGRGTVLAVSSTVMWGAWFAVHHLVWGIGWEVEFWSGTIVFATLTAIGLELLLRAGAPGVDARNVAARAPKVEQVTARASAGRTPVGVAGSTSGPMRSQVVGAHGGGELDPTP